MQEHRGDAVIRLPEEGRLDSSIKRGQHKAIEGLAHAQDPSLAAIGRSRQPQSNYIFYVRPNWPSPQNHHQAPQTKNNN